MHFRGSARTARRILRGPTRKMPDDSSTLHMLGQGGLTLIQIEFAQRLAIGSILGLAQRLGKLFLEKVILVLYRVHRLAENRFLALILLAHGLGRRFKVLK